MSAFQLDIPVRSTGIILLGFALYFLWNKDNNVSDKRYDVHISFTSVISVICLAASAACYQPIALMFMPSFLLISLFNKRFSLTNIGKGLIVSIVSLIVYFLLWKFSLSLSDIVDINSNEAYDINLIGSMTISSKFVEAFNNFIDFIILPKASMPALVSIFITLFSAQLIYIFIPSKNFLKKSIFTSVFVIFLIGLIPTLIFIYKGVYTALRPQALLGMYLTPALLIGVGVERANTLDIKMGKYLWLIAFFLIGIQSFQTSSTITHKQAAYEKDLITGQAIVSDLMNVAPNPSFITVNIFIENNFSERTSTYFPERNYYSIPRNRWEGIGNCHVFDCQLNRVPNLLKIVAPAQVRLTILPVEAGDSILKGLKMPLEQLPSWPNQNSIKLLPDDSLLLKIGTPEGKNALSAKPALRERFTLSS